MDCCNEGIFINELVSLNVIYKIIIKKSNNFEVTVFMQYLASNDE